MALKEYCFDGKKTLKLREMPTGAGDLADRKEELQARTKENMVRAAELQERLYAARQEGLIFALQARDAAGKDSLIKKVFSRLNPVALKITSFKAPNRTDLAHDYMWRINRAMPERGIIGVFNRSHYEDVLVVQVHQMQKEYNLPPRCKTEDFFQRRYRQLNNWEQYLWENGYRMVKVFLNVSEEEQKRRFLDRMELPAKHWKLSAGDMKERALTRYRRLIRRPNADNEDLPVIFNDYMNCLFGDPTAEKEYPMIDKAALAGCEYYVIDAGWYADGEWWDGVGEWKESALRFPEGLRRVTDYIRSKGMIPGLWLELEVMGINCPLSSQLPDDWFFTRHGRRITDRSRYQLDFSNPAVREHADRIIDRLVQEYGAGYIKMDYNIEPGIGTTAHTSSAGEGLLRHNRAYLDWLSHTFTRYPQLVIENCSSGGLRMDYAMLSLYSLQSTSDNEDYRVYPAIAANSPMALAPEQAAVWSYPLTDGDMEECAFNLVSAILLRIHQSGHLASLDRARFNLVSEGIACYKDIRSRIKDAVPFWPLGLASYSDEWVCFGLHCPASEDASAGGEDLIAVWRCGTEKESIELPLPAKAGQEADAAIIFPSNLGGEIKWNAEAGRLQVTLPAKYSGRLIRVR